MQLLKILLLPLLITKFPYFCVNMVDIIFTKLFSLSNNQSIHAHFQSKRETRHEIFQAIITKYSFKGNVFNAKTKNMLVVYWHGMIQSGSGLNQFYYNHLNLYLVVRKQFLLELTKWPLKLRCHSKKSLFTKR